MLKHIFSNEQKKPKCKHALRRRKGFSLIELVIVIAILAVLLAILAPALMSYTEKSRAQKDYSTMDEVANAIQLSLSEPQGYDEILIHSKSNNYSCYIDQPIESGYSNNKTVTKPASNDISEQYTFDDDARLLDELEYYAAGSMRGVTITFEPKKSEGPDTKYSIKDAVINKFIDQNVEKIRLEDCEFIYNRVRQTVGDYVVATSQTYRNSDFTIFIRIGSTGGNQESAQDAVQIYGQYNGTNLPNPDQTPTILTTTDRAPSSSTQTPDISNGNTGGGQQQQPQLPPSEPSGGGSGTTTNTCTHTNKSQEEGIAPTCTQPGSSGAVICDACNSVVQESASIDPLGHDFGAWTRASAENHERKCQREGCDEIETEPHLLGEGTVTPPTCTESGTTVYACIKCEHKNTNYTPSPGHKYEDTYTAIDDEQHYRECQNGCGEKETLGHTYVKQSEQKGQLCTDEGTATYVCADCQHSVTETIPGREHQYDSILQDPTCTEQGYTNHTCAACGHTHKTNYTNQLGHDFKLDTTQSIAATCTQKGLNVYVCARCGHRYEEEIAKQDHQYVATVAPPTCVDQGYTKHECSCGENYTDTIVQATGVHDYVLISTIDATCTQTGTKTYECSMCGASKTETIPLKQHDITTTTVDPTCLETGYTIQECKNCDYENVYGELPALGHKYSIVSRTEATCDEDGEIVYECDRCGHTYSDTLEKFGHDYTETIYPATCLQGGYTLYDCKDCDHSYRVEGDPASGHVFIKSTQDAPTCTADGTQHWVCNNCGVAGTTTPIPATGHNYTSTVTNPTCTTEGYTTHTCTKCGDTYQDSTTPKAAHNTTTINAKDPTCGEDGYTGDQKCINCQTIVQTGDSIPAAGNHNFEVVETIEATCEQGKTIKYKCDICGAEKSQTEAAIGHNFGTDYESLNSSQHQVTCQNSGCTKTQISGHILTTTKQDATCTTDGYQTVQCQLCSYQSTSVIAGGHTDKNSDAICDKCQLNLGVTLPEGPIAVLYSDGTFIFQATNKVNLNHGSVVAHYSGNRIYGDVECLTGWLTTEYYAPHMGTGAGVVPWLRDGGSSRIKAVIIEDGISPAYTTDWFSHCSNLTSVKLGNGIKAIGSGMFQETGLRSIGPVGSGADLEIPSTVTSIGSVAFTFARSLRTATIPSSIEYIGNEAFDYCSSLSTITFESGVGNIGKQAFSNCSLLNIVFEGEVKQIGSEAFLYSTIRKVTFNGTMDQWLNIQFIDSSSNPCYRKIPLYFGDTQLVNVSIPESVTSIKPYSFYGVTSIKSVSIPSTVMSIGKSAFEYCTGITEITIDSDCTWYYATSSAFENGTAIDVSDPSVNATNFTNTYKTMYWYNDDALNIEEEEPEPTNPCVTGDTLVTLADGTKKRIDSVTYDDQLLVWDSFKGEFTTSSAAIIFDHGFNNNTVITLNFSDGTVVKVTNLHQFMNMTLNKYVSIDKDSVYQFVGHEFVKYVDGKCDVVTLVSYDIKTEYVDAWGIISAFHYNILVEDMLSTDFMLQDYDLFNYFTYGQNVKFDTTKMQNDIEKYGLYTYDDFDEYLTYEQFVGFNVQYFKIPVEKGLYTYEDIINLINTYLN